MNHKGPSSADSLFGTRAIIEAIRAGKEFENIFIQRNLQNDLTREALTLIKKAGISFSLVPLEKLNRITRKNHQGIVGFISPIAYASIDHIITTAYESGQAPFILVLDRITDVRNFGAITRTAECAGMHGIVIASKGNAMITGDAIKTSAGALHHIPVCRHANLKTVITYLKENGLFVLACTEKSAKPIYEIDLNRPLAIILGSEENGISPEYLKLSDARGMIPVNGKIKSLNVSVASGIVVYEALRQRRLR